MPTIMLVTFLLIPAAYLVGAIPFGYLIAKAKGVDLFRVGSGNIGATNVGRTLGRKFGILVFVLDFIKGAAPVALVPSLLPLFDADDLRQQPALDWLRVAVALAAFLGHLFPVYLKFHGGKGVATGAGTVFVLVTGPAAIAVLVWTAVVVSTRTISLASIVAALALCLARLVLSPGGTEALILTGFCALAAGIVVLKHKANLKRLLQGAENRIEARPMIDYWQRALHLLALSLWLGSGFFNMLTATTIFATFQEVAQSDASDRTAYFTINAGLEPDQKKALGNALAGAAVGPVFPILFGLHAICGTIALITALGWWKRTGLINRVRVIVIGLALALTGAGWVVSQKVTELRLARFSPDTVIANAAKADFGEWHLISLGFGASTLLLTFAALMLAARLPDAASSPRPVA
jgi:acyl phosphate:glycerol-3-phosphate acyltransferase